MISELKISAEPLTGGGARLVLEGVLDVHSVPQLERALVERQGQRVVLDLSRLRSLSSAGAGALLTASARATRARGGLALASAPRSVREVLDTLGIPSVLLVAPSVDVALAGLPT
jgi:anti-anti-sigma factor